MWEISQEISISAEHRLRSAPREEERGRHRHAWRIKAVVRAAALDRSGWVMDFEQLTSTMKSTLAPFDGAFMNDIPPFDDIEPSREQIARVFADRLAAHIDDDRIQVVRLEIWEGETRCTSYLRRV